MTTAAKRRRQHQQRDNDPPLFPFAVAPTVIAGADPQSKALSFPAPFQKPFTRLGVSARVFSPESRARVGNQSENAISDRRKKVKIFFKNVIDMTDKPKKLCDDMVMYQEILKDNIDMMGEEIYEFHSEVLKGNKLFRDMEQGEIDKALRFLPHEILFYKRGDVLVHQGEVMPRIGIVLEGSVKTAIEEYIKDDASVSTTRRYGLLETMGIVVASSKSQLSPFVFSAEHACTVLWIDYWHIKSPEVSKLPESLRYKLHMNAQFIHADLTIRFSGRTRALEQRTAAKKIMYFFRDMAGRQRTKTITLEMTSPKLAEYLGMDKSTLSKVLEKLEKEDEIIRYKNRTRTYTICDIDEEDIM
jgi:CRP-like cAMP-binding protein